MTLVFALCASAARGDAAIKAEAVSGLRTERFARSTERRLRPVRSPGPMTSV